MPVAVRVHKTCPKCGTKIYFVVIGDYVDETKHDCKQVQIDNLTARIVRLEAAMFMTPEQFDRLLSRL